MVKLPTQVPLTCSVLPGEAALIAGCRAPGSALQFTVVFWAAVAGAAPVRPAAPAIVATTTAGIPRCHTARVARTSICHLLSMCRDTPGGPASLSFSSWAAQAPTLGETSPSGRTERRR
ncbi:hypothetical protein BEK98_36400 [Streptomyces diastatochromogenes]|uniref:Uncharacterized protein n=1 Tax=Streptomyces diastatochromogenes TaxID=42236 RepID=A0A233S2H9_STRDA|nr:hypothetical protein BEK98_36400 [Streptomyces diastatochromogenes]